MSTPFSAVRGNLRASSLTSHLKSPVGRKIFFWNVHGYSNIVDLKDHLGHMDILCVYETWSTSPSRISSLFFRDYLIHHAEGFRDESRGRASDGLAIILSKKFYSSTLLITAREFIIVKVNSHHASFLLCAVYLLSSTDVSNFIFTFGPILSSSRESFPHLPLLVGGDFYCRIANFNNNLNVNIFSTNVSLSNTRTSYDNFFNNKGSILLNFMDENELFVCNGRSTSDSPANFTFNGLCRSSVIDLLWCSLDCADLLVDFEVLHLPTMSGHFLIFGSLHKEFTDLPNIPTVKIETKLVLNFYEIEVFKNNMR